MTASLKREFDGIFRLFQKNLTEDSLPENDLREVMKKIIEENSSPGNRKRIEGELFGYGPLEPLLHKPLVNEIIINNRRNIACEEEGKLQLLEDSFLSDLTFNNIVERLSTEAGLTVNLKKPFAEGKWRSFRIHITRPPLVERDFHVILRKHPKNTWTFERLLQKSWAPPPAVEILKRFVREKLNFLIVGPTGSGKTSVLNACLQETDKTERIISIEDAGEIVLPNPVSLKLLTQTAPESALALIGQEELVRQSLRLRPDRIVMGEVRGAEAKDLLLALASGHRGSIGTLHSETHKQALWKMETLTQIGAPQWQSAVIQRLLFSSLQGVVVVGKDASLRLLKGIYRITGLEPTGFLFENLFERVDLPPER